MSDRTAHEQHGWLGFQGAARRDKVASILSLAGVACICLGVFWTACYTYFKRAELAAVFIPLVAVGILALRRSRRSDGTSLLIVAHGVFLAICAIALIDPPIAKVPRSVHLFLLPLAAGAAVTFEQRERYGSLVFPMICLAVFAAFAVGVLDSLAPGLSPPLEVRSWGVWANTLLAVSLLAAIFGIYRLDVGKRLRRERELGRAVRNGEIAVHYQPQVRGRGEPVAVEALARWHHPSGRVLSPVEFIPIAEESGLIRDVGLDVLRQACELLQRWSGAASTRTLRVAVNISPVQLQDRGFAEAAAALIQTARVDPSLLEFEVTESALSHDTGGMIHNMEVLETLGVTWALDDFGTGYSSLATLRTLPVRKLKIDRQFVEAATHQESARHLLGKIIEISQVMGMSALAEGVETPAQHALLLGLGCELFQGYLFGRPMPAEALSGWMARHTPNEIAAKC